MDHRLLEHGGTYEVTVKGTWDADRKTIVLPGDRGAGLDWLLGSEAKLTLKKSAEKAPRPLTAGEVVQEISTKESGKVASISGQWAWVEFTDRPRSVEIKNLERTSGVPIDLIS